VASEANPDTFNVSELTRTDALYFTVSTFASVGFGDIVATTESSRALVTVQMILNLIVLGAVVRILISAVQRARRSATGKPRPS
jgi:voltage-gated potassium channel